MTDANRVNRRKYQLAQEMIRKGAWIVDAEAGTIRSRHTGRALGLTPNSKGYRRVAVYEPGAKHPHSALMSRVIWEYVHGEIPDLLEVNHMNGVKADNRIANLELATQLENIRHAVNTGLWTSSVIRSPLELKIAAEIEAGRRQIDIAAEFAVSRGTVRRVDLRRAAYVPPPRRDPDAAEKACAKCGEIKPIAQFARRTVGAVDGRASRCSQCSNQQQRDADRKRRKVRAQARRLVTEARVVEILRLLAAGLRQDEVAKAVGVSQASVSNTKRDALAAANSDG